MVAEPPHGESRWIASRWIRLDYANAVHAPDTYGAVLVANGREEPLLVTHGVIRQEVWRVLRDPLALANGAVFFRYVETFLETKAEKLAQEMYDRWGALHEPRLRWRYFTLPDGPSTEVADAQPSDSDPP